MNLATAFRYHRAHKRPALKAMELARADVLKHADARAHYETVAAIRDADPTPENVAAYREALKATTAARRYVPSPAALTWQPGKPGFAYVERPESFGLRFIGNVEAESHGGRDTFSRRDSCGWYTDPFGDVFKDGTGLVWGVVYQLPARDGRARFVAGYQFGGVDGGPCLDLGNVYESESMRGADCAPADHDDARDAARAADSMAERAAEQEREYQTAWQCGRAYDDARQEALEARTAALALLKERRAAMARAAGNLPAICAAIRDSVRGHVATIADARETMRKAIEGEAYGLCVYMDSDARTAFCEAAGLESFPA